MFQIAIILFIAFAFRLVLSQWGFHHDLLSIAGWGDWIFKNGTKGFYENSIWIYSWPTQLPFINWLYGYSEYIFDQKILWFFSYIAAVIKSHNFFPDFFRWWFDFVYWLNSLHMDTPYRWGYLLTIKLISILADIAIGLTIFLLVKRVASLSKALLLSAFYLFSPFSWYLSANWAQYDQLGFLLLLLSFLSLYRRWFVLSSLLLFFSIQIKPTGGYFAPLYVFYFFLQRPSIISIVLSFFANFTAFYLITLPFVDKRNPFLYTQQIIYHVVFFKERFEGLVNHAFNFWQMLMPFGGRSSFRLLGIPAFILNYISLTFFFIWSILIVRKNSLKNLLLSLYILASGLYLFSTGMVDRYFFPSVVFLLLLIPFYPQLLRLWLMVSAVFFINMLYSWGFPFWDPTYEAWTNGLIIRFFSFMQIVLFFQVIRKTNVWQELYQLKILVQKIKK